VVCGKWLVLHAVWSFIYPTHLLKSSVCLCSCINSLWSVVLVLYCAVVYFSTKFSPSAHDRYV
jgi:hypothetical protein